MTFAIDVNVLLYASDAGSPLQARARDLLDSLASRAELFHVDWSTLFAYLRIATHPGVFAAPLPVERALENVEALLGLPNCRVLAEGPDYWNVYREVTAGQTVRGDLVSDARLVALLVENGVRVLLTTDRDFRKFEAIEARDPFA